MRFLLGFMTIVTTSLTTAAIAYFIWMWQTVGVPPGELDEVLLAHFGLFLLICVTVAYWILVVKEE